MSRKYIDPPTPIMDVLDAALNALGTDKRFRSVPNGHLEVSWCQPRTRKDDAAPARYRVTVECLFDPSREANP